MKKRTRILNVLVVIAIALQPVVYSSEPINIDKLQKIDDVYFYQNKPYTGTVKYSNEDCGGCGLFYYIGNIKNGKWHGKMETINEGETYIENYKEGKLHGKWEKRDDEVNITTNYEDGKLHGEWKEFRYDFEDNKKYLYCVGNYKNGNKHGEWKYFDRNGNLERVENYEDEPASANTFTDPRDGKTYKTVKIGEQTWMAKNLDYAGEDEDIGACSDNEPANCQKYGRLYDWENARLACPDGWHLPSYEEWQTLAASAGGTEIAGQKLKARNGWEKWNCELTDIDDRGRKTKSSKCNSDSYGFSALPSSSKNISGYWWTATRNYQSIVGAGMLYNSTEMMNISYSKSNKLSVRCLKGEGEYSGKSEFGGRRSSATDGLNDGYAEGGSGGIGDMMGGLMGGSAGGIGSKAKGSLKAPSARDIDMGSGDGARSKAEIMAVVNARMPGLRNIYNKYLKLKPGFSGKVTLKFTIAPGGDIIDISIVSSTTSYAGFDNAVKNMVGTWKWKAIKSGNTTPTIPFDFRE
ncbi:MAG: TonB family protein [Candidatus Fibromonas sp.]|jgi:TonB family protein|nr:TonB family protein [Candidatus Fibromonas sp.]